MYLFKMIYWSGLFGLTQFLKYLDLFIIKDLVLLLIQSWSPPSIAIISFEIKLLIILRLVLYKNRSIFISTLIWEFLKFNDLRNHVNIFMFIMPNMTFISGRIKHLSIKLFVNYLVTAIRMEWKMNSRFSN